MLRGASDERAMELPAVHSTHLHSSSTARADADCESEFLLQWEGGKARSVLGKASLDLCGSDAISEESLNFGGLVLAPFVIAWGLSLLYYTVF